ncbi:GNAT family protein [Colletotrichum musicola]|uniref:GNAT family protein n=1 Tax=Colletotrichum musicola TaxID=2175873 RepID=A0A8H6KR34_9PEZI|nr:GNAT family protein [Colletotrichum musicola]
MSNFTITSLPNSPSPSLIARYKSFRLNSLRLSPSNFSATHSRESAFPEEVWTSRLTNPLSTTIIATNPPLPSTDLPTATGPTIADSAPENEWLASLVVSGPLDRTTLTKRLHLDTPLSMLNAERQYVLNGMYVIPSARGKALGVKLVQFAKHHISSQTSKPAQLSLVVDYDNEAARKTYENCGFEVVHRHWFNDYRPGRGARTEAAVMAVNLGTA